MARTARPADLPLDPVRGSGPLPQRLAAQLRGLVADGSLHPGDPLPSTRALAARLGVSRGSVVAAYEQLIAEGYLAARQGGGTRVSADIAHLPVGSGAPSLGALEPRQRAAATDRIAPNESADTRLIDLRPRRPALPDRPSPSTRAAWRRAAADPPAPVPVTGLPVLRSAIAERLRRVRTVTVPSDAPVVTAGARDGLALLLATLAARRGRPLVIGFEAPGSPGLRRVPPMLGHRIVDAPTDAEGLDPARLPDGIDALVVTPSHQFPTGGDLPLARRLAVLEHARAHGAVVIEDDHDAEWRWSGAPLPALAGLDRDDDPVVALLGTYASLLGDGTALGHLVPPAPLAADVARMRAILGSPVGVIAQAAAAELIVTGELDRRVGRRRGRLRHRLALVAEGVAGHEHLHLAPVPGGITAVIRHDALSGAELAARAREHEVLVTAVEDYWGGPDRVAPEDDGVLLGFGGPEDALVEGLRRLAAAG